MKGNIAMMNFMLIDTTEATSTTDIERWWQDNSPEYQEWLAENCANDGKEPEDF